MKQFFIILGVAAVGIYALKKVNLAKNVSFSFYGVNVTGNILKPQLTIKLKVSNPTNTGATIKNINAAIGLNGEAVGTAISNTAFYIQPNNDTIIEIICNLTSISVLQSIIKAITDKKAIFNVNGWVTADIFKIPIKFDYIV